ncbi:MAG TPA: histidine phosphatase family protein [Acidimicrobiales bacterium]|jgi:probable phosphoglycerate mutase|nr:histidine phosphatase family protein [Acidimicrobiales bacterium]
MAGSEPTVWLVRHGQTEWSANGRHTGRSDIPLTAEGDEQALTLGPAVQAMDFDLVLCSPRIRAQRTAALAGLVPFEITDDLQEWDYGEFEGLTTAQIHEDVPDWTIWEGPWRGGETADDVADRADRLIEQVRASGASRVALIGHGHFSRVTAARWVAEPVPIGRWLELDTATWSELGWDRGIPVVRHWNVPARP